MTAFCVCESRAIEPFISHPNSSPFNFHFPWEKNDGKHENESFDFLFIMINDAEHFNGNEYLDNKKENPGS